MFQGFASLGKRYICTVYYDISKTSSSVPFVCLAPCEIVPVIDDEALEKVNLSGYLFLFSFLHI
jgi:hypothetical protein